MLLVTTSGRRRIGAAAVAVVLVGAGGLVGARAAGPLPPLAGPPLTTPTRLRLIVNTTPPVILDVDAGTTTTVPGVVPGPATQTGQPQVESIVPAPGGAYVTVFNGRTYSDYLISVDGTARRVARATNAIPARNSDAVWTLTSRHGSCTLRLVPSSRPAVRAPCGDLEFDSPTGLVITESGYWVIVNPSTGRVRRRIRIPGGAVQPINGGLVLVDARPSLYVPGRLALVNTTTGTRRHLPWPSILPSIQKVAVEPHGPLVAVGFVSVAYPGPQQANDVWLLNTKTASFTHLPGFPAQESIKVSSMAWTAGDRLVVVAESGNDPSPRAVLGVWQPGQTTLPLRNVPPLAGGAGGYAEFVALAG